MIGAVGNSEHIRALRRVHMAAKDRLQTGICPHSLRPRNNKRTTPLGVRGARTLPLSKSPTFKIWNIIAKGKGLEFDIGLTVTLSAFQGILTPEYNPIRYIRHEQMRRLIDAKRDLCALYFRPDGLTFGLLRVL